MNDVEKVAILEAITSRLPMLRGHYDPRRNAFVWQTDSQTLGGHISYGLAAQRLRIDPTKPGCTNEAGTVVLALSSIIEIV